MCNIKISSYILALKMYNLISAGYIFIPDDIFLNKALIEEKAM